MSTFLLGLIGILIFLIIVYLLGWAGNIFSHKIINPLNIGDIFKRGFKYLCYTLFISAVLSVCFLLITLVGEGIKAIFY